MGKRTMRGETAIIGIGETTYYKRGRSPDPEFKLVIEAILKACADAGSSRRRSTASPRTPTTATTRRESRRR